MVSVINTKCGIRDRLLFFYRKLTYYRFQNKSDKFVVKISFLSNKMMLRMFINSACLMAKERAQQRPYVNVHKLTKYCLFYFVNADYRCPVRSNNSVTLNLNIKVQTLTYVIQLAQYLFSSLFQQLSREALMCCLKQKKMESKCKK